MSIAVRRAAHPATYRAIHGKPPPRGVVPSGAVLLQLMTDGSGQVVTDTSGNAYHGQLGATSGVDATDPAWASYGVNFDPTDDYIVEPIAAVNRAEWTILAIARPVATTPATQRPFGVRYDASNSKILVFGYAAATGLASMSIWNGTSAPVTNITAAGGWPAGAWALCGLSFVKATGVVTGRIAVNGVLSVASVSTASGLVTPDIFRVGNVPTATTQPMDNGMGAVLVLPRASTYSNADFWQAYRWARVLMRTRGETM